eukprot:TRINITY_DN66658_c1_g8_i7.p2 TRINITY_DN66658_c1_g8~~TRINITY_DN66658_c1_g8_i7.p2  ORF type:complete len:394 (-),score=89.57 TRINITY_DN66658_c1_g8_i7:1792-2973(-)
MAPQQLSSGPSLALSVTKQFQAGSGTIADHAPNKVREPASAPLSRTNSPTAAAILPQQGTQPQVTSNSATTPSTAPLDSTVAVGIPQPTTVVGLTNQQQAVESSVFVSPQPAVAPSTKKAPPIRRLRPPSTTSSTVANNCTPPNKVSTGSIIADNHKEHCNTGGGVSGSTTSISPVPVLPSASLSTTTTTSSVFSSSVVGSSPKPVIDTVTTKHAPPHTKKVTPSGSSSAVSPPALTSSTVVTNNSRPPKKVSQSARVRVVARVRRQVQRTSGAATTQLQRRSTATLTTLSISGFDSNQRHSYPLPHSQILLKKSNNTNKINTLNGSVIMMDDTDNEIVVNGVRKNAFTGQTVEDTQQQQLGAGTSTAPTNNLLTHNFRHEKLPSCDQKRPRA